MRFGDGTNDDVAGAQKIGDNGTDDFFQMDIVDAGVCEDSLSVDGGFDFGKSAAVGGEVELVNDTGADKDIGTVMGGDFGVAFDKIDFRLAVANEICGEGADAGSRSGEVAGGAIFDREVTDEGVDNDFAVDIGEMDRNARHVNDLEVDGRGGNGESDLGFLGFLWGRIWEFAGAESDTVCDMVVGGGDGDGRADGNVMEV